jgi:hypothetical protein
MAPSWLHPSALSVALLCLAIGCASSTKLDGPPADAAAAGSSPEAGVVCDALDASAGPDAPAAPLDGAGSPSTPESGRACANGCEDGLSCTTDTCVAGACQNALNPGYCVVDRDCYTDGDTKPGDTCQACNAAISTSRWTPEPEGALCAAGKSCQSQVCAPCGGVGQACCGPATLGTCLDGAACDTSTRKCQADLAVDISGSEDTVCARFGSGRVRCWGRNGALLGTHAGSNVAGPPIAGLEDAVDVSVGGDIACAVRATGAVVCWGSAVAGGAGPVPGITTATQVSVGKHTCVRTAESRVLCWGDNAWGQLGLGATGPPATIAAQEMLGVTDAQKVAACGGATCVLRKSGQVSCTGAGPTATSTISDLSAVPNAVSLSCSSSKGSGYFWAVTQNATLVTWGSDQAVPGSLLGVGRALSAERYSDGVAGKSCEFVVQPDHTLLSVGDNTWGQLGDGTFTSAAVHVIPRLIHSSSSVSDAVAVAGAWAYGGSATTCLLRGDGSVSCAGQNGDSGGTALGDGQQYPQAPRATFVPVVGILPVASEDGQCYDGVDNDGDGKTDLDDPDCAQDLGSATGQAVATGSFAGVFGNYLKESCNGTSGGYGGPEAVLTWTAPTGGTYQFDTSGSTFDTVLAAFKGNPVTSCTEPACNDDDATLSSGASAIRLQVIAGDKLNLVVDSKSAPTGAASFTVNITKR